MSHVGFPCTYVSMHKKYYESMPKSIQIQMDNNTLFTELNHIETKTNEEQYSYNNKQYAYRHTEPLIRIINVFSDNVNYVNRELEKFIPFENRTFEQYAQEHPNSTFENYESDEKMRRKSFRKENFEVAELYKLTPVLQALHQYIMRVAGKMRENGRIDPQTPLRPFSTVVEPKHPPAFFNFNELRKVNAPIQIEDPVIESSETVEIEAIEAPAPTAAKIDVTLLTHLGIGQSLGICCEPHWDQQPIAFAPSDGGWKGQFPVNQLWKFVILDVNGKVTHWEQAANRCYDAQTQAFTLQANEVKF